VTTVSDDVAAVDPIDGDAPGRTADASSDSAASGEATSHGATTAGAASGGVDPAFDEVLVLACAEELGELLAVYWPASSFGGLLGWSLIALFPFAFLIGSAPVIPIVATGAVLWPVAARSLVRNPILSRRSGEKRIYLYEQGLVHTDAKGARELYRWDQIHTVFRRVRTFWLWAGLAKPRVRCLLTRADGRTIVLTNVWSGVDHLEREVSRRVARAQVPAVRAALERGRRIQFGALIVDAAGVSGPRRSAPWSHVTIQDAGARGIRLHAADNLSPLSGVPEWKIPNVQLLLTLICIHQQEDVAPR
jgi:hypothetical protein